MDELSPRVAGSSDATALTGLLHVVAIEPYYVREESGRGLMKLSSVTLYIDPGFWPLDPERMWAAVLFGMRLGDVKSTQVLLFPVGENPNGTCDDCGEPRAIHQPGRADSLGHEFQVPPAPVFQPVPRLRRLGEPEE